MAVAADYCLYALVVVHPPAADLRYLVVVVVWCCGAPEDGRLSFKPAR